MSRLPLLFAAATVFVAACDVSTQPRVGAVGDGADAATTPLLITPSTVQINVGAVFQFSTNAPLDQQNQLQWRSSQPSIAAVTPTGVVQGIAPGSSIISVRFSFDTTKVATATVTVNTVSTGMRIP